LTVKNLGTKPFLRTHSFGGEQIASFVDEANFQLTEGNGFHQTNKQTNPLHVYTATAAAGSRKEAEYSFSGFIPTNKKTNKMRPEMVIRWK